MADIKSALEMALERAEQFGRATKEELATVQHREQGRELAVRFFKEELDLAQELQSLSPRAQGPAREAIKEVFLRNLGLPRNGDSDPRMERALEGLLQVAQNQKAMAHLKGDLDEILQHFFQIRNNALQQLKARFGAGVVQMQRNLEAQMRQKVKVEVEHLPQFQEEWRRFLGSLHDQFEPMLEECKAKMLKA